MPTTATQAAQPKSPARAAVLACHDFVLSQPVKSPDIPGVRSMPTQWSTTTTAFTITTMNNLWLMVRHQRLGITTWELPGGHVDPGEPMEAAATRETLEETGVPVTTGALLALCVHEWRERAERKIIAFFAARPADGCQPSVPETEPEIDEVDWLDPLAIQPTDMSALLHPLVDEHRHDWERAPITYWMTHQLGPDGLWRPAPSRSVGRRSGMVGPTASSLSPQA